MIRFLFALSCLLSASAFAGDAPCQGKDCYPLPSPPPPQMRGGFCDGNYDGFLANQPGPLALQIRSIDDCGGIEVAGQWNGNSWVGRGFCQQINPGQATIVFQFPYSAPQRGMVTILRDGGAEFDGAVDGGDSFRLMRH